MQCLATCSWDVHQFSLVIWSDLISTMCAAYLTPQSLMAQWSGTDSKLWEYLTAMGESIQLLSWSQKNPNIFIYYLLWWVVVSSVHVACDMKWPSLFNFSNPNKCIICSFCERKVYENEMLLHKVSQNINDFLVKSTYKKSHSLVFPWYQLLNPEVGWD